MEWAALIGQNVLGNGLCVDKTQRKKNIAPQLIQTHVYNKRRDNASDVKVCLFKREGELTNIVPLCVFNTYGYIINNNIHLLTNENSIYKYTNVDKNNIYYLYNFFNENRDKYDCFICPEISNLISLIESKNMFIKMFMVDNIIQCVYIFKRTNTFISSVTELEENKDKDSNKNKDNNKNNIKRKDKEKEIITCIASMMNVNVDINAFVNGFKQAFSSLLLEEKWNQEHIYLSIEDVSDNRSIIKEISIKVDATSKNAYFFYNYIYKTIKGKKMIVIT